MHLKGVRFGFPLVKRLGFDSPQGPPGALNRHPGAEIHYNRWQTLLSSPYQLSLRCQLPGIRPCQIWLGVSMPRRESPVFSTSPKSAHSLRRAFFTASSLFKIGEFW